MSHTTLSRPLPLPPSRPFGKFLAAALLAATALAASAQQEIDPPGRVGRISLTEGAVSFAEAGGNDWTNAQLNRPLTRGDRLWVDRGARGEAHIGSTAVRLGALTHLEILALDDTSTQLNLTQGSLSVRIREMFPGERVEVGTPNLALLLTQPGEYRIDVDPSRDTTRVAVHSGAGVVYGDNSESAAFSAQQQASYTGRNLSPAGPNAYLQRDAFDQWAEARDRQEEQSVTARYVSRDVTGYQQLDSYGDWRTDPAYGPVWYPRITVADWAPYRYGHWQSIAPWGWTWIDDAPWGFAPFHYGRWAQVGPRWAWVPGPRTSRPVYSPALVAFVGGSNPSNSANWSVSIGSGGPGVAWFPLGPADPWRPGFRASRRYVDGVNRGVMPSRNPADFYANQRRPGAVTAVAADDFGRGRPTRGFQRIADADLAGARVVEPPPTPTRGGGGGPGRFGERDRPAPARALPPTAVLNQPAPPSDARPPSRGDRFGGGNDGRNPRGANVPNAQSAIQPAPQPAQVQVQPAAQPQPLQFPPTRDPKIRQQQEAARQAQEQQLRVQQQRGQQEQAERQQRAAHQQAEAQRAAQQRAQAGAPSHPQPPAPIQTRPAQEQRPPGHEGRPQRGDRGSRREGE